MAAEEGAVLVPPELDMAAAVDENNNRASMNVLLEWPEEPLAQNDSRRMKLTPDEYRWARHLKEAMANLPELDTLSDFMITQFAIVEEGNLQAAIHRAFNFQNLRREFDILDTCADAKRRFSELVEIMPGHLLHFGFSPLDGNYVFAVDMTKLDTRAADSMEKLRSFMAGAFYAHHAISPDFAAIRQGAIICLDWGGYSFKGTNLPDYKFLKMMFEHNFGSYPLQLNEIEIFNAGVVVSTLMSMVRRFLPEQHQSKMKLGCQLGKQSNDPLDKMFLVPSVEAATCRLVEVLLASIQQRYINECTFRL
ncbi:expressed unknown protein [Seminavis robusta]|uniref:CRAL-TRIO domain-containing protein n=1 Tax=Seminavis robusta TaxID=568900 RepID=A0A9N8HMZ5_9STRA|nr:expressed unknown protein [Seminavis robusta]|eukprot:Sro944_g222930.1 n/a (307) ;mRNA; f:16616-17536